MAVVLVVVMTPGSVTGAKVVSRGGAVDRPLDGGRVEAAPASNVCVISTRCNMNERTNSR